MSKHFYRKKPVVIQAFQMTQERRHDNTDWPNWLHEAWQKDRGEKGAVYPLDDGTDRLTVRTLEGAHVVEHGDWIIRGVEGELYPCKPSIFEQTYERAQM